MKIFAHAECEVELELCSKVGDILGKERLKSAHAYTLISILSTAGAGIGIVWTLIIPPLLICCLWILDPNMRNLLFVGLSIVPIIASWIFFSMFISFRLLPQTTFYKLHALGLTNKDSVVSLEETCRECYPNEHFNYSQYIVSWSHIEHDTPHMYVSMHVLFFLAFLASLLTLLYAWYNRKRQQTEQPTGSWLFRGRRGEYQVTDYFRASGPPSASARESVRPHQMLDLLQTSGSPSSPGVREAMPAYHAPSLERHLSAPAAAASLPHSFSLDSYTRLPSGELDVDHATENCAICCEQLQCRGTVQLPCKHFFHRTCAVVWLNRAPRPTCPLCGSLVS